MLVGHVDPHPTVSGRGLARLRRAGLEVTLGVLEAECREQHRGFLSVCARGRPFVALKLASSLDGRIATASGESRWITGPAARAMVHRLRAQADAVMVGSGTALADDPELTARRGDRVVRRPLRILVDSALRVPPGARLYRGGDGGSWVLCSSGAAKARRRRVAAVGARLIEVPRRRGRLDLRRGLRLLAKAGVTDLLVEGGGGLAAALLREGLVDELHWFVSPRMLGGDGKAALGPLGLASLSRARRLAGWQFRRVGDDLYIRGTLAGEARMRTWESSTDARHLRFAVVVSRFNHPVSVKLLEGCHERLLERGARPEDIHVAWVPGAFEIPHAARVLAASGRYDAVAALGVVIRGGNPPLRVRVPRRHRRRTRGDARHRRAGRVRRADGRGSSIRRSRGRGAPRATRAPKRRWRRSRWPASRRVCAVRRLRRRGAAARRGPDGRDEARARYRHRSRQVALQVLYAVDVVDGCAPAPLRRRRRASRASPRTSTFPRERAPSPRSWWRA